MDDFKLTEEQSNLLEQYYPLIISTGMKFNDIESISIATECAIYLVKKFDGRGSFGGYLKKYLYALTRNKIASIKKSIKYGEILSIEYMMYNDEEKNLINHIHQTTYIEPQDVLCSSHAISYEAKKKLTHKQLGVLELILEGYNQSEISRIKGCSRQSVNGMIKNLKKLLIVD